MQGMASENKLLASLDEIERAAIAPHVRRREYSLGQVVYDHGDRISEVHFVTAGMISVLAVMEDGTAVETMVIGSEGVVGDGGAHGPDTHYGRALVQMQGASLSVDSGRMQDLVGRHPGLRRALTRYAHSLVSEAQQNAACNAVHRLESRLAKWLLRCHDRTQADILPMTQEFLSYMLGAQRTTVTEVARRLQFAGLIRYSRGKIEVLDRAGLERAACECYGMVQERRRGLGLPELGPSGPVH